MSFTTNRSFRALAVACVAAACGAWPASAQEPATDPGEPPAGPDTVYIPYKDLEKVFETEGQGVFLPYKEFLKLWRAGRPPGLAPTAPPPVPAAITGAEYTGQVTDTVARITARYDVRVLAEGWTALPLDFGALALSNVNIEGPDGALLTTGKDGHKLLAPQPGSYRLELELAARVSEQPGIRSLKLTVPSAPRARLDLTLPGTDLGVDLKPNLAATIGAGAAPETTRVLAFLGPARTLDVTWRPRTRVGPDRAPMLIARTETAVAVEEGAVQARATVHYTILQAPADTFTLRVPRDYTVLSLTGANLRGWDPRDEQGTKVITVRLHSPVEDRYAIQLHLERLAPDVTGDLVVPQILAEGTERERGTIAVGAPANLTLSVGARQGLTQKDPGKVAKSLLPHLPDGSADLAFDYLGGTRSLTLRVAKVTARIRAAVASKLTLGESRHELQSRLNLNVERVGIFTVQAVVPKGYEPIDVLPPNLVDDWRRTEGADTDTIHIDLRQQRQGALQLVLRLQRRIDDAEALFDLPLVRVAGAEKDQGHLAVAVPPGFKVTTDADTELRGFRPVDLAKIWGAGIGRDGRIKLGFAYNRTPATGKVEVERLTAQVSARIYTTLNVTEAKLTVEHQIHYTIEHAGVKRFRFSLPQGLQVRDAVKGKQIKQVGEPTDAGDGREAYTVDLQGDVMGRYVLTVKHEKKLATKAPGEPQTVGIDRLDVLDVFSQEEHVALTKADNIVLTPTPSGYDNMDPRELEGPMRARQTEVVRALRHAGDPTARSLQLEVVKYDFAKTLSTAVNHLHADVVFAGGRDLKALATLEVQNVQRQNLTVRLPAGAKILQVIVAGVERQVSLAGAKDDPAAADRYLIDLTPPAGGSGPPRGAPFVVSIRYDVGIDGGLRVALPVVESTPDDPIPVALETLNLYLPEEEYSYLGFDTNMRRTWRRPGLWPLLTDWLGWDRRPVAEARTAAQRVAGLRSRARKASGALIVSLRLPQIPPRRFLHHTGGGEVSVSYVGVTTAQFFNVALFLAAFFVAVWMPWTRQTPRLAPVAIPAGAALLVSALSESLTPFATAVFLGALVAGGFWVLYTVVYEWPATWRDRGGDPPPEAEPAPAPEPEPAPDSLGEAEDGPATPDPLTGDGDGEDVAADESAAKPAKKKKAKKKSSKKSKKKKGGSSD